MGLVDYLIVIGYLLFSFGIALFYSRRAGRNTAEFFLSGRNLPWWIAGTAMVATTFAADTPLAVTELVSQKGIAGNWLWWNMLFGSMLTVFFFARLWRRGEILTDVEFAELRYSGRAAFFLRGFRALYLGLFMNIVIMGWVNLAMVKILRILFPDIKFLGLSQVDLGPFTFDAHLLWVGVIFFVVALYSSLSGLWGVAITDTFQFVLAMTGTIILAFRVLDLPEVGGIAGLKERLPETVFSFFPVVGENAGGSSTGVLKLTLTAFIAHIGVQWWASWYPGAEPGGGGYIAQRMMSAKNEKHSLLATLWFTIAHYTIRPWPWIIVALASMVLYPDLPLNNKGDGFILIMKDYLPQGLLGLLVAAFFAAYMSTIATQLNWGTSYIINDFYGRFLIKRGKEKTLILASRLTTILLMLVALLVTSTLHRISDAWIFILECSGGIGLVLILRWYWWRINAYSELSAMIAPFLIYPFIKHYGVEFPDSLFIIVSWSTLVWLVVTFLTPPVDEEVLISFFRRVHPGGRLWKPIQVNVTDVKGDSGLMVNFIDWLLGSILIVTTLFGLGKLIFGEYPLAIFYLMITVILSVILSLHLNRHYQT